MTIGITADGAAVTGFCPVWIGAGDSKGTHTLSQDLSLSSFCNLLHLLRVQRAVSRRGSAARAGRILRYQGRSADKRDAIIDQGIVTAMFLPSSAIVAHEMVNLLQRGRSAEEPGRQCG